MKRRLKVYLSIILDMVYKTLNKLAIMNINKANKMFVMGLFTTSESIYREEGR